VSVNVENINKTIARIRANKNFKFNMADWGDHDEQVFDNNKHPCGTSACIAGFASLASGSVPIVKEIFTYWTGHDEEKSIEVDVMKFDEAADNGYSGAFDVGRNYLGLTEDQADALFIPSRKYIGDTNGHIFMGPDFFAATDEDAIRVLEHLRDTGNVDWSQSGMKGEDGFEKAWQKANGCSFSESCTVKPE
jgi:hypothetical protein